MHHEQSMKQTLFLHQINLLEEALQAGLPGQSAQLLMAPAHRDELIRNSAGIGNARRSAVLILLFPDENQALSTAFIKRMEYEGVHSGQVAFPGGKYEEEDKDLIATALREANEEAGIRPDTVRVFGTLSDLFVPPSNFIISPVLACSLNKPVFTPDRTEVAEIFTLPLSHFTDHSNIVERDFHPRSGNPVRVPGYQAGDYFIWGATAMILSELIALAVNAGTLKG